MSARIYVCSINVTRNSWKREGYNLKFVYMYWAEPALGCGSRHSGYCFHLKQTRSLHFFACIRHLARVRLQLNMILLLHIRRVKQPLRYYKRLFSRILAFHLRCTGKVSQNTCLASWYIAVPKIKGSQAWSLLHLSHTELYTEHKYSQLMRYWNILGQINDRE